MTVATEAERRETARRHLDSAESWLRSIIELQLSQAYGTQYFKANVPTGENLISSKIRKNVAHRRQKEPNRFQRDIDATMLNEAVDIVLHPNTYRDYFQSALSHAYPDGKNEARTFLKRLITHRDRLAHGGTCSIHDLEQCACYANDLIDSLKTFIRGLQMAREFNVPTFTRVVDSNGNDFRLSLPDDSQGNFLDFRNTDKGVLYPGDVICLEVEVDESFDPSEYSVKWLTFNGDSGQGQHIEFVVEPRHVGEQMDVRFEVISNKDWHRLLGGCDDRLDLRYRVNPPR